MPSNKGQHRSAVLAVAVPAAAVVDALAAAAVAVLQGAAVVLGAAAVEDGDEQADP